MRKGELCFVLLFLVLFYWPNLAHSHTDLFPIAAIIFLTPLFPDGDTGTLRYVKA